MRQIGERPRQATAGRDEPDKDHREFHQRGGQERAHGGNGTERRHLGDGLRSRGETNPRHAGAANPHSLMKTHLRIATLTTITAALAAGTLCAQTPAFPNSTWSSTTSSATNTTNSFQTMSS